MAPAIQVIKSFEVTASTAQTDGMIRKGAIIDKSCVSASVMVALPHSASSVHHHGAQDTIAYCLKGKGAIISEDGKKRQMLEPGDFALIPAYVEHQEVNDGDEEVEYIITRSGRVPEVVNLHGWGKSTT